MANNLIRIKRSEVATAPGTLANGEFGYTSNGEILFIGSAGVVTPIGGKRFPGVLTANQALVVNSTSSIDKVIVANLVPTNIWANGAAGTTGQVLTSNSIGGSHWSTPSGGGITTVVAGAGMTGGGSTASVTVDVIAGNGISVTADAVAVLTGVSLIANTTGLFVNPSLSITDLTVSGNLSVLGDFVSLNVSSIAVEDALIKVAKDQAATATTTDAVDSGLYSVYGNNTVAFYTGIFRDQSDAGIWKLFTGNIPEPTTIVDTANLNFALSTFQSYLKSGGLVSNLTTVTVTANSTVAVNITGNTMTLTTPLAGTSGGTGRAAISTQGLLTGNSTNGYDILAFSATEGHVLQSNGTAIIYGILDAGVF